MQRRWPRNFDRGELPAGPELTEFAQLARAEAKGALAALIEVMGDRGAAPSARIAAAGAVLGWGFGSGAAEERKDAPTELAIRWLRADEVEQRDAKPRAAKQRPRP
jgi:hypothetical protein